MLLYQLAYYTDCYIGKVLTVWIHFSEAGLTQTSAKPSLGDWSSPQELVSPEVFFK
jgi:hypothetical protein